jgi:hypothetical protein
MFHYRTYRYVTGSQMSQMLICIVYCVVDIQNCMFFTVAMNILKLHMFVDVISQHI